MVSLLDWEQELDINDETMDDMLEQLDIMPFNDMVTFHEAWEIADLVHQLVDVEHKFSRC